MRPLFSPQKPVDDSSQFSDRFIRSRRGSNLEAGFNLKSLSPEKGDERKEETQNNTYQVLLQNELFGRHCDLNTKGSPSTPASRAKRKAALSAMDSPLRTYRFQYNTKPTPEGPDTPCGRFALSPVSKSSQKLLCSPRRNIRKIPKSPFKVLDAPSLTDDFYLNLVDWSAQNFLAVGLGTCVYLWSACTSKVTKLTDAGEADSICSVSWTRKGSHLAVGTRTGTVQIWDVHKNKKVRSLSGHIARVGALGWNGHTLASGSRDRSILLRDVRSQESFTSKLEGHKQEVCGLKWSFDEQQLASGGNDNKLLVWNASQTTPILKFSDHKAAVKAIAWSPHQHGFLASGGGTADRCIRFWNTLTSQEDGSGSMGTPVPKPLNVVDTGSQVCNLMWSKNVNEIASTHGYSLNQVIVWKYPSMTKLATLTGHTCRVLYLACSPDGQTIVTGAGD